MGSLLRLSYEYWHPLFILALARGIDVPLRLDGAMVKDNFRHFTHVLVDIDVSSVPSTSLLLERDDSRSSFITLDYENPLAFSTTCSSIGHLPNAIHWNKSGRMTLASSGSVTFSDLTPLVLSASVSPSAEVFILSVVGSVPISPIVSRSLQTRKGCYVSISKVLRLVGKLAHRVSVDKLAVKGSKLLMSDSQAELHLIMDSSWTAQAEEEELDDIDVS
ncbi:hypothetical protein Dsin_016483 [Dipteronia sinensis]|uniref:Uncharacterized protein n=1 Tax=Dipteronia sinensis TaxID=43782 RepID=A0AAE0E5S5_9ROSI|nr:hypothetical protein Dsin_016483 [Dipteronia sinensis]